MASSDTTNRDPDIRFEEYKNVLWNLLPRKGSSGCNLCIMVQRFEPGGSFYEHQHDLEQFFYVTKGSLEMTIGGETNVYHQGDFVHIDRNELHSGRNVAKGESEIIGIDLWPPDSHDRIGLD